MRHRTSRARESSLVALHVSTFLFLSATGSPAQDADPLYDFYAEEATVVAASKRPQRLADAPASAYVITAADIGTYGYRTLAEALQSVPGFYATTDRNYTYLWVRGFGPPGDYNGRVLVLVNGHRLNENVFGGAYVGHDFNLDITAVERIEVVKGPGSSLYGDSAVFAVVNVTTRRGPLESAAHTRLGSASFGTRDLFASLAESGSGWDVYAAGSYRNMRGQDLFYEEFATGPAVDTDREENYNFFLDAGTPRWRLQASGSNRRKRVPTAAFGTVFGDGGNETNDARSFVEVRSNWPLAGGAQIDVRVYQDWYDYHGDYVYEGEGADRLVNKDIGRGRWYGEELRLQLPLFGPHQVLMLGQEFERNLQGLLLNYDERPRFDYVRHDSRLYRWAVFAQQELRPHPAVDLTLGSRLDHYESFGPTLNPRAAGVLRLPDGSRFKLVFGSAFRAPTPFEMFYVADTELANPDLEPERLHSQEVHWEKESPRWGRASAGFYHTSFHNRIWQTASADGDLYFVNGDRVHSTGFEVGTRFKLGSATALTSSLVLQRSRSDSGPLSNSPRHSGSVGIQHRLRPWGAKIALETFFLGPRRTTSGSGLPAAAVASLHASLSPAPGLRMLFSLHNLTDADYRASAAGEHVQDAIRQDGRSVRFGLEYRLGERVR